MLFRSYDYRLTLQCKESINGTCLNPLECVAPPNTFRALVERIRVSDPNATWTPWGEWCITSAQAADLQPTITPDLVNRAYQRLDWPASTVIAQPDGTTLVNLPTILHTTNTTPTTRTITLLGITITIEATPTTYTWHHGDGTTTTTTSPGHPYPTPGHTDVTHTYTRAGQRTLSVDTTYTGRYRIANGPWTDIPQPRTITGPTTPLTIRTATPHLIAPR